MAKTILIVACLFLFTSLSFGQPINEPIAKAEKESDRLIKEYKELVIKQREESLAKNIQLLKDALKKSTSSQKERNDLRKLIKEDRELLEKIKSGKIDIEFPKLLNQNDLDVGQTGVLDSVNVFQKLSDTEAICRVYTHKTVAKWGRDGSARGTEIESIEHFVILKGFDFTKSIDGKSFDVKTIVKITGTKTYQTAGGSKTVLVIEDVNKIKVEKQPKNLPTDATPEVPKPQN